ncbi:MAG: pyruvate dehydrogenase (acetyl-transferring) E1 component subunit alpha [Candidatus Latescibacteria bacterium]|nr:pyruvate dehydrogenase (acetyl-transferring) E1 component subunit alpha [bacterium]MCB9512699.1 pyruvate dehydrogenase (acetyl-transferring) E1 component subunit alpha [Candidatus Latescibacterota bacterium]MCB9516783.1 pyruvate dehydrogenase (acetyl-transferring) E1 component subunit alpha [Candidatus Latescibacterota bacterium]
MPRTELASFGIETLQILAPSGEVDQALDPGLPPEDLHTLYRGMVLGREADQRMLNLQRQGRLGTFSPSVGQEAASVGPVYCMGPMDWFVGAFRELGARLMRGHRFKDVLHFWNGREEGSAIDPALRTLYDSIIVGAQIPHAVGLAYAQKLRGEKAATVCWFGDGATSQGDFHEALNFAAVWKAPVVFICQNNQWAISIPRSKQTSARSIAQKAVAYEMPGIQVDGNDVLAMVVATREAIDRAKRGEGPTLIEAVTYRMGVHTTADDPTRYRNEEAAQAEWTEKDPILRLRRYLEARGLWDEARETALREEIRAGIAEEVKVYETETTFPPDTPFDHVFGTLHPVINEQRELFHALLARDAARAKEAGDA